MKPETNSRQSERVTLTDDDIGQFPEEHRCRDKATVAIQKSLARQNRARQRVALPGKVILPGTNALALKQAKDRLARDTAGESVYEQMAEECRRRVQERKAQNETATT